MADSVAYGKRLVKGSTIVFTAFVLSGFIGLLLRMFLARSLTVAEYGLFYAVFVLISFFELFRGLGFDTALVKYIPEFVVKRQFSKIKSSIDLVLLLRIGIGFLIMSVFFIFPGQISSAVFKTTAAVPLLLILGIWFILMGFSTLTNTFRGFQNMPVYASLKFLDNFLVFFLALLMVGYLGLGVVGAAYAYLFTAFVIAVLGFFALRWKYPKIFRRPQMTRSLVKKLSAFAFPVFLTSVVGLVIGYMDTLMLTMFRSLQEVGYYQTARPMSDMLFSVAGSVLIVFFPMVSELWAKHEKKLLKNMVRFLMKFSFILAIPVVLIFVAFPETIIRIFFGADYVAGAVALQILSVMTIFHLMTGILNSTLAGIGKPAVTTAITSVMAVFNFIFNLVLIPVYGIVGAAFTSLASYMVGTVLLFYYTRKFVGFSFPAAPFAKSVAGGILTLLFIFGLKSLLALPPVYMVAVIGILSFAFYASWALATKAVTRDDLNLIARIVPVPNRIMKVIIKLARH